MKLGQLLIEKCLISSEQLDQALRIRTAYKQRLGRILCELEFISTEQLDGILTLQLREFGTISSKEGVDSDFFKRWSYELIEEREDTIIISGNRVYDSVVQEIEYAYGKKVIILRSKDSDTLRHKTSLSLSKKLTASEKLCNVGDPYLELLNHIFQLTKEKRASDLHFEPFKERFFVKIRQNGDLVTIKSLSHAHGEQLIIRLKELVEMDIAIVDEPQDSRAQLDYLNLSVRASSVPVAFGEKIVLRVIFSDDTPELEQLGLDEDQYLALTSSIRHSNGIIFISGPTGSGKTTTLYSLLAKIDQEGKNISTLENPIEKYLPGINQINVDNVADFPKFQRALMRQDPDVILLGEIRDKETADLGLKLSASGHLVLSTIHTNSAASVIERLESFGIDGASLKENIRLSVAQRLVQNLCTSCAIPHNIPVIQKKFGAGNYREANHNGCMHCSKGISGRRAVIEYIDGSMILKAPKPQPTKTLDSIFVELAKKGVIDVKTIY